MTAAQRKTPAPSNFVGTLIPDDYAEDVNGEIVDLSIKQVCFLDNVAGTANAITANARNSPLDAYRKGNAWWIIPAASPTGPATINIDGLGDRNILTNAGAALSGGELDPSVPALMVDDGSALRIMLSLSTQSTAAFRAPDCIFQDQKSQNTAGGGYTLGSSVKRTLNTTVRNVLTGAALAGSLDGFTLPAGSYWIEWETASYSVGLTQSWLNNETDSSVPAGGRSLGNQNSSSNVESQVQIGRAFVTISAAKTFAIRFQGSATRATNGLGLPSNFGSELYTTVRVWQVGAATAAFTDSVTWNDSSAADVNNLGVSTIAGYATAAQIEVNATAAFNLTGLSGGVDQRRLAFINTGTQNVTFKQQAAGSTAANRIASADFVLAPGESVIYRYSANQSRWYREA